MKRLLYLALAVMLLPHVLWAQDVESQLQPAPSVSRYESSRLESARRQIHHRAAWKAAQRRQRLDYYKWLGYSPLRPPMSPMQFMGSDNYIAVGVLYYNLPGILIPTPRY